MDALSYHAELALSWQARPEAPAHDLLARCNEHNEHVLRVCLGLDHTLPETMAEQGAQQMPYLEVLDQKVQVLIEMVGALLGHHLKTPQPRPLVVGAQQLQWSENEPPALGAHMLLDLYLYPAYPSPLRLPSVIEEVEPAAPGGSPARVTARFLGMSEAVEDALHKFVFRRHRRQVASLRH